jgi:hypothetical protein
MFKIELDVSLYYDPPMDEHGQGISLTRIFEIPFPPSSGLYLTGGGLTDAPDAIGFKIEDVTWDLDRQVFLAETSLISKDFPIAFIPDELRAWVARGWRLGSCSEAYEEVAYSGREPEDVPEGVQTGELDAAERWPSMNPRSRPPHFNKLLRALVRKMADLYNNWATAYAIDQTMMLFSEAQLRGDRSPGMEKFIVARSKFERMTIDEKLAWREKVIAKHPRLDRIVADT